MRALGCANGPKPETTAKQNRVPLRSSAGREVLEKIEPSKFAGLFMGLDLTPKILLKFPREILWPQRNFEHAINRQRFNWQAAFPQCRADQQGPA